MRGRGVDMERSEFYRERREGEREKKRREGEGDTKRERKEFAYASFFGLVLVTVYVKDPLNIPQDLQFFFFLGYLAHFVGPSNQTF